MVDRIYRLILKLTSFFVANRRRMNGNEAPLKSLFLTQYMLIFGAQHSREDCNSYGTIYKKVLQCKFISRYAMIGIIRGLRDGLKTLVFTNYFKGIQNHSFVCMDIFPVAEVNENFSISLFSSVYSYPFALIIIMCSFCKSIFWKIFACKTPYFSS